MRGAKQQAAARQRGIAAGCDGHRVRTLGLAQTPGALHQVPARRAGDILVCGESGPLREVR